MVITSGFLLLTSEFLLLSYGRNLLSTKLDAAQSWLDSFSGIFLSRVVEQKQGRVFIGDAESIQSLYSSRTRSMLSDAPWPIDVRKQLGHSVPT